MKNENDEVSRWLIDQLSQVPDRICAVYIEWDHSYIAPNTPEEVVLLSMNSFGFEHLKKGTFDCSNPDQLGELGNFVWEGWPGLNLKEAEYPKRDWTEVLKEAAMAPAVRELVRRRGLLLLVGYHDDAVFDVS